MTSKVKLVTVAIVCMGLLIILIPGFASPSPKLQSEVDGSILPSDPVCAHAPWPFGCEWGATTGRKKILRKSQAGHGHHPHTAMRQGQVLFGSKL
jgi:hypothetical protein